MGTIATTEGLHPMPAAAYPAILTTDRVVSRQALVSYRGNRYSVPPELACAAVTVTHVLGSDVIYIVTTSGITIARHRLAAGGTGAMVRDHGHIYALEQVAIAGANTGRPHRRKERIPPGPDALAAANTLRTITGTTHPESRDTSEQVSAATESDAKGAIV